MPHRGMGQLLLGQNTRGKGSVCVGTWGKAQEAYVCVCAAVDRVC